MLSHHNSEKKQKNFFSVGKSNLANLRFVLFTLFYTSIKRNGRYLALHNILPIVLPVLLNIVNHRVTLFFKHPNTNFIVRYG